MELCLGIVKKEKKHSKILMNFGSKSLLLEFHKKKGLFLSIQREGIGDYLRNYKNRLICFGQMFEFFFYLYFYSILLEVQELIYLNTIMKIHNTKKI